MDSEERLAYIKTELEQEWERHSEEIKAIREDLSLERDKQYKLILERKLKISISERERIHKQLHRIEQGKFLFSENIIADSIEELRQQKNSKITTYTAQKYRIINNPPPIILHNFQDRQEKIKELRQNLFTDGISLIIVEGQSGIGKTALVYKLLTELEKNNNTYNEYEREIDGIIYIDTRFEIISLEYIFISISKLMPDPITQELHNYWIREKTSISDRANFLLSKLQNGFYLLVIDNFEKLLNKQNEIIDESLKVFLEVTLLNERHGLRIIITNNIHFRLPPPLSSRLRVIEILDGLPDDDAIEYLRSLDPNADFFFFEDEPEELLRHLIRKVHGIPGVLLSIANLFFSNPNLSISTLLKNKELFLGEIYNNIINENYNHLHKKEKLVLETLAVYNRPIEFVAIAYILNNINPNMEVNESLRWLVSRLIVVFDRKQNLYSLPPQIRDFIYNQISENERREFEKKVANFYKKIKPPQEKWASIEDLEPYLFEFEHLINATNYDTAISILEEIEEKYLLPWGYYNQIINMRIKLYGKINDKHLACINQMKLGRYYGYIGDEKKAFKYLNGAINLANELSKKVKGRALGNLAIHYFSFGEYKEAMQYYKKSLPITHQCGDLIYKAHILGCLGSLHSRFGEKDKARKYFNLALNIDRKLKNRAGETRRLFDLGVLNDFEGDYEIAIQCHEQALLIAREIKHTALESDILGNLGNIYFILNNPMTAIQYCEKALDNINQINHPKSKINNSMRGGTTPTRYSEDLLDKTRHIISPRSEARTLARLGNAYFQIKDYDKAVKFHKQAIDKACDTEDKAGECIWLVYLGFDQICAGEVLLAKDAFLKAEKYCKNLLNHEPKGQNLVRYYFGLSMIGLAIIDPNWPEGKDPKKLIYSALCAFEQAKERDPKLNIIQPIQTIIYRLINLGVVGLDTIKGYFIQNKDLFRKKKILKQNDNLFYNGYGLLIGVNLYKYSSISNLPATVNDVNKIKSILLDPNKCAYVPENIRFVTGKEATRKRILEDLNWLITKAKCDPEATIIFYYSGHGFKSKNDHRFHYYLIPYDYNIDDVDGSAINEEILSEKLNKIITPRLVVFIDSCHAGGVTKEAQSLPSKFIKAPFNPALLYNKLKTGKGRIIISSSKENERSFLRKPDYKYSIFTYHLIEAFSGNAHTYTDTINIIDIYSYLAATVPKTAEKQIDDLTGEPAQQHPIMDGSKTDNFPIGLLYGGKGSSTDDKITASIKIKKSLTTEQINRLKQRQKELQKPLDIYIEQRSALETDIALAELDMQKQTILKKRLQMVEIEICKLQQEIDNINYTK